MVGQGSLSSKRPVIPLSARRGKLQLNLKMTDTPGTASTTDSLGDALGRPSVERLDAKRFCSVSSVETACTLDWDSAEEVRLAAHSICQMGYDVHEVLGSGSMAVVYRVTSRKDGQEFAAKCVKGTDDELRSFTIGEHNIMKELVHDNILHPKGLFEFRTQIWLCTELCVEGNVHSYIKRHGAFDEGRCRTLAKQLVDGLEHLHSKRVVHRDIKPENIFLGNGASRLKIGDFNSAKKIGTMATQHAAVWMLSMRGTPLYSAPELRFNLAWNERVDIWGMGLSVYFMARAASPFNVGDSKVIKALREGRLPQISWHGMSTTTAHLVKECLTVDMRDRPSAMELQRHPAFEAVNGDGGDGSAQTPKLSQSGSDSTVRSSCGLLFSCTTFQASRSGTEANWRSAALRTLALENIPTLEKLPSLGVSDPWAV